jgi:hypothetical protein
MKRVVLVVMALVLVLAASGCWQSKAEEEFENAQWWRANEEAELEKLRNRLDVLAERENAASTPTTSGGTASDGGSSAGGSSGGGSTGDSYPDGGSSGDSYPDGGSSGGDSAGLSECEPGLSVNSSTSCAFARNVREALVANGYNTPIDVYSPTTGETYTLACVTMEVPIICEGGNNALVSVHP